MQTGDLKQSTPSIKELLKRLSISGSSTQNESDQNNAVKNFVDSLTVNALLNSSPIVGQAASTQSGSSTQASSSMGQLSPTGSLMGQSENSFNLFSNLDSNENNPFDINETREYFRTSHEGDMKKLIINNSLELRNLWVQIYHTSDGLTFQVKSINKFKKINNCITGAELVDWLIKKKSVEK